MNLDGISGSLILRRGKSATILFALALGISVTAFSAPSSLNYQGRILKSDGTPLEYQAVLFDFIIMDASGQKIIYEETSNAVDMRNSGGVFDVPIGTGTKVYPDSSTLNPSYNSSMTLLDAFNNDVHFYCKGSGANASCYSPLGSDARVLRVQFYDGTGWKLISPDSVIRSVPFAGYSLSAQKLGTNVASDFVLKNDINNPGSGSLSCDGGSFLTWDASSGTFGCDVVSGASGGTVTNVTASSPLAVTNGTSTPNITIQVASSSQNGYLSSSDWTTFNNKLGASTVFVGDVSGTASTTSVDKLKGTALSISGLGSNQFLKYNGTNWMNSALSTTDISGLSTTLSGLVAQSQFPASCAANQTLTFVSPSGSFTCSSIAINGSQVSGDIAGNAAGFTGSLAGDVSGTQGATSVDKIKGVAVSATAPTSNQVLTYTGGAWTPASLPSSLSGSGTAGYVPYYSTSTTLANSNIYYNGSNVGIGTTNPGNILDVQAVDSNPRIMLANTSSTTGRYPGLNIQNYMGSTTGTPELELQSARGTFSAPAALSAGDEMGHITFDGHDGTDFGQAVTISGQTTQAWTTSAHGSKLVFGTTPNGSTAWPLTRMTIDQNGNVGIGITSPSQKLEVNGNIKGTQLCIGADCRSAWPGSGGGGTVTSVASGTGLTGGPITGSGTLAVDVGTAANQIVQLDSSAKLPAVDGSALTNLNAANLASGTMPAARMPALTGDVTASAGSTATTLAQIQGKSVTISSLATGDFLKYNGTGWVNDPLSSADLSDSSSLIKSSQMPANCAAGQTLTFSSPTGTWACSNIVVTASNFGSQTQNTFLAAPSGSAGTPTFRTITSADLPGGTLSGSGTAGYVPYYSGASTLANSNIYNSGTNVGVGTTSPAYALDIRRDPTATSGSIKAVNSYSWYSPASAPSAGTNLMNGVFWADTGGSSSLSNVSVYGVYGGANHATTTTLDTAYGAAGEARNSSTGTLSKARGVMGFVQNSSSGTIGNAMGVYSTIKNPSGTVTTGYGVYIDSIQATNKYGLYQADATAQNIFSGNVGIGTTYANTKLQVNGGSISNDTSIYLTQNNAASNPFNAVTLEPYVWNTTAGSEGSGFSIGTKLNGADNWDADFADHIYTYVPIEAQGYWTYLQRDGDNDFGPFLYGEKNRGTFASKTAVLAGDDLLDIVGSGYSGSGWNDAARITFDADQNFTSTAGGGAIFFATATNNTKTLTERMVINNAGNVGIGTTNPTARLAVANGDLQITTSGYGVGVNPNSATGPRDVNWDSSGTQIRDTGYIDFITDSNNDASGGFHFLTGGINRASATTLMTILMNGRVGIGTTAPTALLHVNGAALATAWNTSSDIRLKTNIDEIQNPLDKILRLRGVEFDWRSDVEQPTKHEQIHDIGVIAQEVEKQFPEAVTTALDGYKSVAYSKLVAPLIGAVKALYARITGIENQQADQARRLASVEETKADKTEMDGKFQALEARAAKAEKDNAAKDQEIAELKARLSKIEKALSK